MKKQSITLRELCFNLLKQLTPSQMDKQIYFNGEHINGNIIDKGDFLELY